MFSPVRGTVRGALLSFAVTLAFSAGAFAADPGKIVVQVDKPGAKISPMLFGLMTEEINHSYDGGLYGELIKNRIFKKCRAREPGGEREKGGRGGRESLLPAASGAGRGGTRAIDAGAGSGTLVRGFFDARCGDGGAQYR